VGAFKNTLVALFKCKMCGARLFFRDCKGHLERHGIHANGDTRTYFVRGKRDTYEHPGGDWKSLRQVHRSGAAVNPTPQA